MLLKAVRSLSLNVRIAAVIVLYLAAVVAGAQSVDVHTVPDRLVQPVNERARVTLAGTVHPLANRANDHGAVADGLKLDRMQVVLKRSDAQETELKQLIGAMHTPGSASYHKWVTPEEFGQRFGPSDADVAKVSAWLQSHGFSVTKLNPGRQTLEFSGTAGAFRETFKAQIHTYVVKGETRYANAADPQIPAALAPVFGGFASLNNFRIKSYVKKLGTASYEPTTHKSKPDWTVGNPTDGYNFVVAPGDFAVQYDLTPLYTAGTTGTGQSIAIVNESNINIAQVNRYRTLFGLPANPPQVIIDGNDPGIDGTNDPFGPNGASIEAYLDVEEAGAVAPNATVNLVIAGDTALQQGLELAAERAVYGNISPVISLSFGECELGLGSTNSFFNNLWEQAAAQGITVMVSTGDSGSAGCDDPDAQEFAVYGQAVSGFASTPYDVAVGGTDFYYSDYNQGDTELNAQIATYWSGTASNATPTTSILQHIPEQPWNDSQFGLDLFSYYQEFLSQNGVGGTTIAGGSGGASNCAVSTTATNGSVTCTGGYAKPSWQTGTGVPADNVRDIPDVSLFASDGSNASYIPICYKDGDCEPVSGTATVQITGVGGTSASSPAFAGIMALVNQKYGRQGQANYVLYPLAAQYPAGSTGSPFNDVVVGSNSMPCATTDVTDSSSGTSFVPTDCISAPSADAYNVTDNTLGSTTEGQIGSTTTNVAEYNAGVGYDLASGLGTIDATNLLAKWNTLTFAATTTTLTPPASTSFTHGAAVTLAGSVATSGGTTPTGQVSIETDSIEPGQQNQGTLTLDASGNFTGSLTTLPGGSYNVFAYYAGDGKNAASTSAKVPLTVGQQSSTTTLTVNDLNYFSANTVVTANEKVPYGSALMLATQTVSNTKGNVGSPTGSVAFSDGTTVLNTAVVNTEGDAEYKYIAPVGTHSLTASYAGDASYTASTASALTFQVVADTPAFGVNVTNQDSDGTVIANQPTILTVFVENSVGIAGGAAAPTGTLTMAGAPSGSTTTATLLPSVDPSQGGAPDGIATFTIPAGVSGTYNLSFTYSGDGNYTAAASPGTANGAVTLNFAVFTGGIVSATAATATVGSAAATQTSPTSVVVLTTTVTGTVAGGAPTGEIAIYSSGYFLEVASLGTGTGDAAVATVTLNSQSLSQGTNQLTIQYLGDNTYFPSSTTVNITNPLTDFQMVPLTTIVSVPTSGTASTTINLASTNSFAGAVSLTCSGAGGVTCSLNPASTTLAAGGSTSTTLTISSTGVTTVGTYNVIVTGTDTTGQFIHTLGLQAVVNALAVPVPGITVANSAAIAIASQGASGSSTVTVTATNSYVGSVALTCAVTSSPSGATEGPTCAFSQASVSIAAGAASTTSTLTISTTATTTTSQLRRPGKTLFTLGGGATMAALLLFGGAIGRRGRLTLKAVRTVRLLSAAALFALIASSAVGCGGSSSSGSGGSGSGGGTTTTGGTTTGAYTVTVTATPTSGTAVTTTVAVTVN